MPTISKKITIAITTLILLASCDLETSDNGKLDGQWHLIQIQDLTTNQTQDLTQQYYYWQFQGKLLQLRNTETHEQYLLRFQHDNTTLRTYEPYIYNREEGDQPITDPQPLNPFGITQIDQTFEIEHLGNKYITLKSNTQRISLKRF